MSLENLARIGQLVEHLTNKEQVAKLLEAAADYTGELLDDGSVVECIDAAVRLQQHLYSWLNENRPDLLD